MGAQNLVELQRQLRTLQSQLSSATPSQERELEVLHREVTELKNNHGMAARIENELRALQRDLLAMRDSAPSATSSISKPEFEELQKDVKTIQMLQRQDVASDDVACIPEDLKSMQMQLLRSSDVSEELSLLREDIKRLQMIACEGPDEEDASVDAEP